MDKDKRIINSFLFINKLVGKETKFKFFEFSRHMLSEIEIKLFLAGSIHKINLIFIIQDDEYVVMRVIVKLCNDFFFMLDVIFRENKSIAILDRVFIIFELINQLIVC